MYFVRQFCVFIKNTLFQEKKPDNNSCDDHMFVLFALPLTHSKKTCLTVDNMAIKLLLILLFVCFFFWFFYCYCFVYKHEAFFQLTMGEIFLVQLPLCVLELINKLCSRCNWACFIAVIFYEVPICNIGLIWLIVILNIKMCSFGFAKMNAVFDRKYICLVVWPLTEG